MHRRHVALNVCFPHVQDKVKIDYRPVHQQPLDKEMKHIPPMVRSY